MKIQILFFFILFFAFSESALAMARLNKFFQRKDQTASKQQAKSVQTGQKPKEQVSGGTTADTSSSAIARGSGNSEPVVRTSSPSKKTSSPSEPLSPQKKTIELVPRSSSNFYSNRVNLLQPSQRKEIEAIHLSSNCVTKVGQHTSCGYRKNWSNTGDPYFTWDRYMNKIERGTPVDIEVKCDPKKKRFVTNVSVNHCTKDGSGKKTCKKKYFVNPYFNCSVNKGFERCDCEKDKTGIHKCKTDYVTRRSIFSDTPQNWLTSPGIYFGEGETNSKLLKSMKTELPSVISRTEGGNNAAKLVIQESRVAGNTVDYEGARMPNLLWLSRNGNAFHGSDYVDGRPRSQGCLRLSQGNAMALYRLGRRVGSKNFTVKWKGYGPIQKNGRPLCAQSQKWNEKMGRSYANAFNRNDHKTALNNLVEDFNILLRREARVPVASIIPATNETAEKPDALK